MMNKEKELSFNLTCFSLGKSGVNTPSSGVALLGNSGTSGVAAMQVAPQFLQQVNCPENSNQIRL